ncbi:MAG: peptidase M14 [Bacteroidetes bacterium]|nr:peptidase M14 [Bacteroidota bacterium]
MTPSAFAAMLHDAYPEYRLDHLTPSECQHQPVRKELLDLVARSSGLFALEEIGKSVEGRTLSMVKLGTGPRRVMLWSQMHGDEPTATLALLDILHGILMARGEEWVRTMLQELSLFFIPLVNPDGAELRQRRSVTGIDINRDAEAARTPEAEALRRTRSRLRPEFGFNLHDQELSSVGESPYPAAMALLAPPASTDRKTTTTRLRAIRVCALISRILEPYARGRITRYDDTYEPRAFGDTFQASGTSTILIESGHWPKDPQKAVVRELNVIGILTALRSIGNGSHEDTEFDYYHRLPPNGKRMVDLLIRGVHVRHPSGWERVVDVGVMFQKSHDVVMIKDIGDLHTFGGLETIELADRAVASEKIQVDNILRTQDLFDTLQTYHPLPPLAFRP